MKTLSDFEDQKIDLSNTFGGGFGSPVMSQVVDTNVLYPTPGGPGEIATSGFSSDPRAGGYHPITSFDAGSYF